MRGVRTDEVERVAMRAALSGQHAVAALLLAVCCAMEAGVDVELALHVEEYMSRVEREVAREIAARN